MALVPPRQFNPKISVGVNAVIMYGMGLYPEERPQSVKELLNLLNLFLTSKPDEVGIVKPHPLLNLNYLSKPGFHLYELLTLLIANKNTRRNYNFCE